MSISFTMPTLFSWFLCLLLFTFQPPFIPHPPSSDLSLTPPSPYIPRPRGTQGPAWPACLDLCFRDASSLEQTSDRFQNSVSKGPENMSNMIPQGVYMTLLRTHRKPCSLNPRVCVMGRVFLCPLCPCPERLVGALCLNLLFVPPGEAIPFFGILAVPCPHVNSFQTHT